MSYIGKNCVSLAITLMYLDNKGKRDSLPEALGAMRLLWPLLVDVDRADNLQIIVN